MKRPEMAPLIAELTAISFKLASRVLRPRARVHATALLMEMLDPYTTTNTRHGSIKFYCPAVWPYARSDMGKEPETYEWIDSFEANSLFWDVGANIGVYSLYAARRGHKVLAFEPAGNNYFVLTKNIEINGFDDCIQALNVALNDKSGIDSLYMAHAEIGGARHSFGRPQTDSGPVREHEAPNDHRQAVLGFTIDDFIETYKLDVPNHIKIDVDGNELLILRQAQKALQDRRLKSVLVEVHGLDRSDRDEAYAMLARAGFDPSDQAGNNVVFRRNKQMQV